MGLRVCFGEGCAASRHAAALVPALFLIYYPLMHADSEGRSGRLPADQVDLAVEVFRMLADATRVQILWALIEDELSVGDLAERAGKAPASVSQHLAKLRMARLVRTRREGTTIFYRLGNDHVARLITDAVYNAEHAGPGIPGHHRDPAITELPAVTGQSPR
jgi:DNA-binding transcriptional ArsR family regulator